jgi:hypothetical protein
MGVSGITYNKLFNVKSLDPSDPFKVGFNGVIDYYEDGYNNKIVKYEIDDILYTTYLSDDYGSQNINKFSVKTYDVYDNENNISPINIGDINTNLLGNVDVKNIVGSKFNKKYVLKTGQDKKITKSYKKNNPIPVDYKEKKYSSIDLGDTIFETKNFSYEQFTEDIIYKNDKYIGLIDKPKVSSDLFMERGQYSIFERHQRLSEINNLASLFNYRNGYYTEIKTI